MRIRRLHPSFGAEVLDMDLSRVGAPAEIEQLSDAFDEHQLLLFRGQGRVAPERQVEICSWLGTPACERADGTLWTVLSNDEAAGAVRLEFHCDHSYTAWPIHAISLLAIDLPSGPTTTAFVSSLDAWARLTAERQAMLAPLTLRHRLCTTMIADTPEFNADHPLRLINPRSGLPVLFVTEHHAHRILELEPEASARLLDDLFAHLYAPEQVYRHQWEPYDLLIWDNLAIQHARPENAERSQGKRVMQRVALSDIGLAELLARASERQLEPVAGRR